MNRLYSRDEPGAHVPCPSHSCVFPTNPGHLVFIPFAVRESDLLDSILSMARANASKAHQGVHIGPGDDCAALVLPTHAGNPATLLASVDHCIDGRHFLGPWRMAGREDAALDTTIDLIARKAIARSVSDIAAMAGQPLWCLATAAFPDGFDPALAQEIAQRLHAWAIHWHCPIVGGDIASLPASSPLVLTVTILGRPHPVRGSVTRSGAKPGDRILVTGTIGGSFESGKHLRFEPRIREATALADVLGPNLHALIDLSDGLGRDAARIAKASGVRITLDAREIPWTESRRDPSLHTKAAGEGEDYELLAAVDPTVDLAVVRDAFHRAGINTPIHHIAAVRAGQGCTLRLLDGATINAENIGWDHGSQIPTSAAPDTET